MSKPSIHLMGIGGIGMANFALLLMEAGYDVTGSDGTVYEPAASLLHHAGIAFASPYAASNLPSLGTPIVVGNALSRGNAELEAALDAGHSLTSFPEFMHRHILEGRHPIVVAGTHGKSTTASCIAHILCEAGHAPGFLIGASPLNFPSGACLGSDKPFVIEGDEYDTAFFDKRSKFLHYFPRILVLGSVEYDHADIFPDLESMLWSYRQLIRILPRSGAIVYAADSPLTCELVKDAPCSTTAVGTSPSARWQLLLDTTQLSFRDPAGRVVRTELALPGEHNRMNCLMAMAAAMCYENREQAYLNAMSTFRGIRRRLERVYYQENLIVYDDFAHHPTAIRASIRAVRQSHPAHYTIAIFEPRSNTMVRNIYQRQLADALSEADTAIVGSVHRADRIPTHERLDIDLLKSDIERAGVSFVHGANAEIAEILLGFLDKRPTTVLFMSNGSFDGALNRFLGSLHSGPDGGSQSDKQY